MKLKINTIVVDDMQLYADIIKKVLSERNSKSNYAEYLIKDFTTRTHYEDAKNYIFKCIDSYIPIDLIFCDYNLGGGKNGIDFFKLFEGKNVRPYRILHSQTRENFTEKSEEFVKELYDQFSHSKSPEAVNRRLEEYEENVLKVKLYGNPKFTTPYYRVNSLETLRNDKYYNSYKLRDILYILTKDDTQTVVYRLIDDSTGQVVLNSSLESGKKYRIDNFLTAAGDFNFLRLNQSLLINLLWVSKVDTINQKVHFIVPDSKSLIIESYNTASKFIPKEFDLRGISDYLHRYFL